MYFIKELDNGIRVVMEKINNINSISFGVIVENGSRNEDINNNGISHFIEHILFRGTNKKTSKDISKIIDMIGGNLNAFTSKENTCFYAQILIYHLDLVIDLLSDMFLNPSFNELDIEKEKKIVEKEISMYVDDSEDLVHELLNEVIYENTSLSLPILGDIKSINKFNNKILRNYFSSNYTEDKIIISLAGNINFIETYKKLNESFGQINRENNSKNDSTEDIIDAGSLPNNRINCIDKEIEQFNLCLGLPGPYISSTDIYSYLILSNIFVNNESSRLYQAIREKGLAYSIYSGISSYKDVGDISIYMGLNNGEVKNTLSIVDEELNKLNNKYVKDFELDAGKEELKINYILENENSLSKMFQNAKSISLFEKIETQDEILDTINNINKNDIIEIINKSFKRDKINISFISDFNKKEITEKQIKKKIFRSE